MRNRAQRFLIRVAALASKEALHVRRDPRTLALALAMPVVMLLLFGYGVSFDLDHIPTAVVDLDRSAASRQIVRHFFASGELALTHEAASPEEAERLLAEGRVLSALTIPRGAERELAAGERVTLQLAVDGADGVVANQVLFKSGALARATSAALAREAGFSFTAPIEVKVWTRFNPTGRSALFLVPGLSAFLLAIAAVLLTALAIASEWENGSMEQLFASPVGRVEIIFGKLLPYLALGSLQFLLVLSVGAWIFEVPIRGSIPMLFFVGLLFLVGMLGQGLLVSVVTRNQLVATQAGALSSLLPSMLLSGFVFPIESMPLVLQWLSRVIPARYLVHALRAIMLKGAGFSEVRGDLLALTIFGVAVLGLATAKFRRRLA